MTPSAHGPQDGLTLALNAAESILQLAFADADGRLIYSKQIAAASRGVEILAPALDSALTLLDKKPDDIRRIAAVTGPGSFTGIRLVISTAAGIARAVRAEQAPLDYMQLIARQCLPFCGVTGEGTHICVITRARRDLVYIQAFARNCDKTPPLITLTRIETACVSSGQVAQHILDTAVLFKSTRVLLAGSGVKENHDGLVQHLAVANAPRVTLLPVTSPTAETLIEAALDASYDTDDLAPLYVRASDAEVNLPRIAASLGLDPDEAEKRLAVLTHEMPDC